MSQVRQAKGMNIVGLVFGAGFGFVLGAARLHEYETIHRTLRLQEPDVFLLMACAIGTSLPLLWLLERRRFVTRFGGPLALSKSPIKRDNIVGGALFGIGWALAGTCPAPALVMVTSGAWLGLVAVAGLFIGLRVRDIQVERAAGSVAAVHGDGEGRALATSK